MHMKYSNLLKPIKIGNHIVKNRLVYPNASPHFLQGPETFPAEGYRAFAANLAKNGAGIVNFAEWADPGQRNGPADMDFTHMQSFDLSDPSVHNYIAQMAQEVHFYGSKILITLQMPMPEGYNLHGGKIMRPGAHGEAKPLPAEMIPEVINSFVEKAEFYKLLGFDGISYRCDMEMAPKEKERGDEYGGSLENRTRLLRDALAAVKNKYGGDFIIEGVIAWEQPDGYGHDARVGSGYSEQDAMEFIRLTEGVIDVMQIRENNGCNSHPTGFNFKQGVHPAMDFAARVKSAGVKMIMQPIGGFQEPDEMDSAIAAGKCDMFGVSRGLLADPEYGVKAYAGRGEDITPCLKCNKCHGTILPEHDPWVSVCSVNPIMGMGSRIDRLTARSEPFAKKRVAVIGGGCSGMRAAVTAAGQGHDVTLYEKTDRLGGQLIHGDTFSFKWPIGNFKRWLIEQTDKSGVKVIMNTEPSAKDIENGGFDVVFAATGAEPNLPESIKGLKNADGTKADGIFTCKDVWEDKAALGKRVVICGGSEIGVETAMHLCEKGHEVTVLTRQKEIGHDVSRLHYMTASWVRHDPSGMAVESAAWEKYDNLHSIVNATTKQVKGGSVVYSDKDGNEQIIEADSVVICGGMTPLRDKAMEYAGLTDIFFPIGDCNFVGNIQKCNEEAYARGMII